MGFTVDLYSFSKKINSTAQPGTPGATHTCVIKEPCSVYNPVISLNLGLANSPVSYNYAYIPTFNRYYFIKDWTFQNALWTATLEVDVLASWKTQIGASTCYVLRSSNSYDLDIVDTTYPTSKTTTTTDQSLTTPWVTDDLANGMFIVGIAGQSTTYYLFYKEGLDAFFDYLFSDTYANALVDGWLTVYPSFKAQCNPLQFITSIMWLPFQTSGTAVETIRVGYVNVPVAGCSKVDGSGVRWAGQTFNISRHPQATRGNYLNIAPYTTYRLFYPPWGMISLDSDIMANSDTLNVIWVIDLRTGAGTLFIYGGSTHLISIVHAQVCINYQVSQVLNRGFGVGNVLAPLAGVGAGLATGNWFAAGTGALSGGIAAIGDAVASKIPSVSTVGSNGGLDSLRGEPTLLYEFKEIIDEDLSHRGRPLCQNKQISTIPGYIIVSDADISLSATDQEQAAIRSNMEGGFFYE